MADWCRSTHSLTPFPGESRPGGFPLKSPTGGAAKDAINIFTVRLRESVPETNPALVRTLLHLLLLEHDIAANCAYYQ